jgi:hypothetical protein
MQMGSNILRFEGGFLLNLKQALLQALADGRLFKKP